MYKVGDMTNLYAQVCFTPSVGGKILRREGLPSDQNNVKCRNVIIDILTDIKNTNDFDPLKA